jgi:hypothetical protein
MNEAVDPIDYREALRIALVLLVMAISIGLIIYFDRFKVLFQNWLANRWYEKQVEDEGYVAPSVPYEESQDSGKIVETDEKTDEGTKNG